MSTQHRSRSLRRESLSSRCLSYGTWKTLFTCPLGEQDRFVVKTLFTCPLGEQDRFVVFASPRSRSCSLKTIFPNEAKQESRFRISRHGAAWRGRNNSGGVCASGGELESGGEAKNGTRKGICGPGRLSVGGRRRRDRLGGGGPGGETDEVGSSVCVRERVYETRRVRERVEFL